jgi:hypothetical protein
LKQARVRAVAYGQAWNRTVCAVTSSPPLFNSTAATGRPLSSVATAGKE